MIQVSIAQNEASSKAMNLYVATAGSNSKRNPILIEDFGKCSVTKSDADLRNTQHCMRTDGSMSCPWESVMASLDLPWRRFSKEKRTGVIMDCPWVIRKWNHHEML